MRAAEEALAIRLAYCLGWEVLSDVRPLLSSLRENWRDRQAFSPLQRAVFELYEEQPTTVAETRMLGSHIIERLVDKSVVRAVLSNGVSRLPEEARVSARRHPLLLGIETRIQSQNMVSWKSFFRRQRTRTSIPDILPGIERESDFLEFLSLPGFRDAFEKYWHFGPRARTARRPGGPAVEDQAGPAAGVGKSRSGRSRAIIFERVAMNGPMIARTRT